MAADANPVFEVATIKPSDPEAQGKIFQVRGRHFATVNTTLSDLITFAYGIHPRQITGGPSWLESEKYDLSAEPDGEGQPNGRQWKIMIQKLLADRFKLTFHRDKKELSVYAIVVGKNGTQTHQEPRRSERPSRPVLPGARSVACQERNHGGLRRRDAGRRSGSAGGGSDGASGKIRLHTQMDSRPVSVRRPWSQIPTPG